jgi:hypothetical protein
MEFDLITRSLLEEVRQLSTNNNRVEIYVGLTAEESEEYYKLSRNYGVRSDICGTTVSGLTFGHGLNLTLSNPCGTTVSGLTFGHGLNLTLSNLSACTAFSKSWHAT